MVQPDPADLAKVPLFDGLTDEQLASVAERLQVEEYQPGQTPIHEGQHGYAFFILAEGTARAEHDGEVLEHLQPGAVFGEMAFFAPNSRRSATIVCETPITVLAMFGTAFRTMQAELPEVARRIEELAHARAARSQDGDETA